MLTPYGACTHALLLLISVHQTSSSIHSCFSPSHRSRRALTVFTHIAFAPAAERHIPSLTPLA